MDPNHESHDGRHTYDGLISSWKANQGRIQRGGTCNRNYVEYIFDPPQQYRDQSKDIHSDLRHDILHRTNMDTTNRQMASSFSSAYNVLSFLAEGEGINPPSNGFRLAKKQINIGNEATTELHPSCSVSSGTADLSSSSSPSLNETDDTVMLSSQTPSPLISSSSPSSFTNATDQRKNRLVYTYLPTLAKKKLKLPSSNRSRAYNVNFSHNGQYCVGSWQGDQIKVYNVYDSFRTIASFAAQDVAWTVTATEFSPNDNYFGYSTLHNILYLAKLDTLSNMDNEANDDEVPPNNISSSSRSSSTNVSSSPSTVLRSSPRGSSNSNTMMMNNEFGITSHIALDLAKTVDGKLSTSALLGRNRRRYMDDGFGIFSFKFSAGGTEIVSGCNDGNLRIFNIESNIVTDIINAHDDDINSVCFLGTGEQSDIVISGADWGRSGTPLKMWDRRLLKSNSPIGTYSGHRCGITNVSARNDGIHFLSVGKDQVVKIWDIRKQNQYITDNEHINKGTVTSDTATATTTTTTANTFPSSSSSVTPLTKAYAKPIKPFEFDYRFQEFPGWGTRQTNVWDVSVMSMFGLKVSQSLIRAKFSPMETTGGRYIASGSACGTVYIWDILTSEVVRCLEPSWVNDVVRDVAWHPTIPTMLVSTSFSGELSVWNFHRQGKRLQSYYAKGLRKFGQLIRRVQYKKRKYFSTSPDLESQKYIRRNIKEDDFDTTSCSTCSDHDPDNSDGNDSIGSFY